MEVSPFLNPLDGCPRVDNFKLDYCSIYFYVNIDMRIMGGGQK